MHIKVFIATNIYVIASSQMANNLFKSWAYLMNTPSSTCCEVFSEDTVSQT